MVSPKYPALLSGSTDVMEEKEVKESKITLREKDNSKDMSIEDMSFS